jgi:hypothetical protein
MTAPFDHAESDAPETSPDLRLLGLGAAPSELGAHPIYIASIGKAKLRFFPSPLDRPDFPWHVSDDLVRCIALPAYFCRQFRAIIAESFNGEERKLATSDGVVTIRPHHLAQDLIDACMEISGFAKSFEFDYALASLLAMGIATDGLSADQAVDYFFDAGDHNHARRRATEAFRFIPHPRITRRVPLPLRRLAEMT